MKKIFLLAYASLILACAAQAGRPEFPSYYLGQQIYYWEHRLTVDNVVVVGRSPEDPTCRRIQVWIATNWQDDPTKHTGDAYYIVELEDKQGNRWAPVVSQVQPSLRIVWFDLPDNVVAQGDLSVLFFNRDWDWIAKVAARF